MLADSLFISSHKNCTRTAKITVIDVSLLKYDIIQADIVCDIPQMLPIKNNLHIDERFYIFITKEMKIKVLKKIKWNVDEIRKHQGKVSSFFTYV